MIERLWLQSSGFAIGLAKLHVVACFFATCNCNLRMRMERAQAQGTGPLHIRIFVRVQCSVFILILILILSHILIRVQLENVEDGRNVAALDNVFVDLNQSSMICSDVIN